MLSLVLLVAPAWGVNKCVTADGKTIYQSAPCAGVEKSSEITIQKAPQVPTHSEADTAELKRIRETAGALERERTIKEKEKHISQLEGRIFDHRQDMNREIAVLKAKKMAANNNLAGATWEQSISEEMSAVAKKYDTLIESDQKQIDIERREVEQLRRQGQATP